MFTHSHAIRSGLSGRLRQSHEEHINFHYNSQYIIAAEFNNKVGPVVKHQYPHAIPGFKCSSTKSGNVNLASLMIPNHAESRPGMTDFTVFILYKDKYTRKYHVFPISETPSTNSASSSQIILEEEESELGPASSSSSGLNSDVREPPLFFLSVVNTLADDSNDRGARINSIALGTPMQNFYIFKPLLAMTLDLYMRSGNDIQILIDCFDMVNSLDLSFATRILANTSLQGLLNSVSDEELIVELFNTTNKNLQNILHLNKLPTEDNFGNKISFKRHLIEYQFTKFKPKILPPAVSRISLQIDMINYDPIKVNINYNDHVLKFLLKFIPLLDKLPRSRFSWKLLVNSTKLPKDTLCQFILSLSNFIRHFDSHYFENAQVIIFPYMDISFIDALRRQLESQQGRRLFTIVGVSNPIFECQMEVWDFYYDMDSESLRARSSSAESLKSLSNESQETIKSSKIKNIFQKRMSYAPPLPEAPPKCGLTSKMITYLVNERHNNETTVNVFKRINILQILCLLMESERQPHSRSELSLKDEYVVSYRDFVIFPELFEYSMLKLIRCFTQLEQDLNFIMFDGRSSSSESAHSALDRILASLKQIHKFMASSTANTDKVLTIGLNFPLTLGQDTEHLCNKDFSQIDLEQYFNEIKLGNSMEMMNSHHKGVVDYFAMKRFQRLLFLPMAISAEVEISHGIANDAGLTTATQGEDGVGTKKFLISDPSLSPISSIFNEDSLFQDCGDEHSRPISSTNGSYCRSSLREKNTNSKVVQKIKKTALSIVRRMEQHPIGKLLLEYKVNPMFWSIYSTIKEEYVMHKNDRNEKRESAARLKAALQETAIDVSPSRRDLLNDLNTISQQQENIKVKLSSDGVPTRPSILHTLNNLTLGLNDTEE